MNRGRIEALTDGIFAIILTLPVIELRTPETHLKRRVAYNIIPSGLNRPEKIFRFKIK